MAKKKFHITPDGVKECRAWHRGCPYGDVAPHYETKEEAFAAEAVLREHTERMRRVNTLKRRLNRRAPEDVYQAYIDVHSPGSLREFAETAAEIEYQPIGYSIHTTTEMDNGALSPVEMTLSRESVVNEQTEKIEPRWVLKTVIANDEDNDFARTEETFEINLDDQIVAEESLKKLHRQIRKNVYRSGLDPQDEELVAEETEIYYNSLLQVMHSAESTASGPFTAWEHGVGYFTESDSETIRVDTLYSDSSFDGAQVREFLEENPLYLSATPDIDIRVSEYDEDGAGWELNTADGHWWIRVQDENGYTVDEFILTEDEAYSRMYHASHDTLGRSSYETEQHAEFAANLMKEVNAAVREHPKRIAEYWEEEKKLRELRDQKFVHGVLNTDKDRDSAIDKIFSLFK